MVPPSDAKPNDQECLQALRGRLLGLPGVREGKMFGAPSFFVGRKLFACLLGEDVGIKVPEELAVDLLEDPRFEAFRPYGKSHMREWVQFSCPPDDQVQEYEEVLLAAYEFVAATASG